MCGEGEISITKYANVQWRGAGGEVGRAETMCAKVGRRGEGCDVVSHRNAKIPNE